MKKNDVKIRECKTLEELSDCVRLQREVFALPEIEISPVRHFIVTLHAGGFTLGAFCDDRLIGFSLSVPAVLNGRKAFYSHMTAVDKDFQSYGIGGKLKWKQRDVSLKKGVDVIKWTFQPVMARNAFFNIEKLGAIVVDYKENFYGTDYATSREQSDVSGIDSDRLFVEWHLENKKVKTLAREESFNENREVLGKIETTNVWNEIVRLNPQKAIAEQSRIKREFKTLFDEGLRCEGFLRDPEHPQYLFYRS